MTYVQFFRRDLSGNISEACGDRSVVILDGRWSTQHMTEVSTAECLRRGYPAWQLFRGETFCRSLPISDIHHLNP
jgi:hypothetical protein